MSVVLIWKTKMNLKQTTVLTSPQLRPEKQPYTIKKQTALTSNEQIITFFLYLVHYLQNLDSVFW